jgi:glutamine amidotransferase
MLGRDSDEGRLPGLGWIQGRVRSLASMTASLPVPHMGWNDAHPAASQPLFDRLEPPARFYFLHSYYFECDRSEEAIALAEYCGSFACAVRAGNVYGKSDTPASRNCRAPARTPTSHTKRGTRNRRDNRSYTDDDRRTDNPA